jgi:outer membrane protein OmpA-like peptidoglycan-associated protein
MKKTNLFLLATTAWLAGCSTTLLRTTKTQAPKTAEDSKVAAAPAPAQPAKPAATVAAQPSAQSLAKSLLADLNQRVRFDLSDAKVPTNVHGKLKELAALLKQEPALRLRIQGYADATGTEPKNQTLSVARARNVGELLVRSGIGHDRLVTEGLGTASPIAPNDTAAGRQANRRAEFTLLD